MKLIFRSIIAFFKDGGPLLAGSIAYFFLLSFVPFSILLISFFGYFLGENLEFYQFLSARLLRFFPSATSEVSRQLTALVVYRKIGIFTFIVYAYFSYQLYMAVGAAVRAIFRQKKKFPFFISIAISFFIVTLIAVLIVVSFAATSAVQMLQSFLKVFPALEIRSIAGLFVRYVIPVLLVLVVTAFLYKLLPAKRISLRNAFRGASFTAVLLEVARQLFTLYVVKAAAQFGAVYGPLSTFVIFLLWIYYSASIFLIGAEIVRDLETSRPAP